LKLGRFIVDTHVHSQRHAAGKALKALKILINSARSWA
jgi:hypothetical protein